MKTLATLIRHAVTYLVGLLVAWFSVHLTQPDELKTATDAANALIEPLVVLAGFVAVILSRLAMPVLNNIFRRSAGENSGSGPGLVPLLAIGLGLGTAAVGTLPSCSPGAAGEYPIRLRVTGPHGTVGYSSKSGFEAEAILPPNGPDTVQTVNSRGWPNFGVVGGAK